MWLTNAYLRKIEGFQAKCLRSIFFVSLLLPAVTLFFWSGSTLPLAACHLRRREHVPEEFLVELLRFFTGILQHGNAPIKFKRTLFTMLPKNTRAKLVTDFRPITKIWLFYSGFAYMILARVEQSLESSQPEAQHGFRPGRRTEEHVLTTKKISDKSRTAGLPLWIISFCVDKTFQTTIDLEFRVLLPQSKRCRSLWCW